MNVKNELKALESEKWSRSNGTVARVMFTFFKRGYFKLKDILNVLEAYNITLEEVLDAMDYFDDMGYVEVKSEEGEITHTYDEEDIYILKFRVTAKGTRLGYGKITDDGIDL